MLADLENRLMAECNEKLTIELMHQKLNACFKRLQCKKEKVEEKEKALAAIKKQIEEKALAVGINNNLKLHAETVANKVSKQNIV